MESAHGGRLNQAAREWGIPIEHWVDLSTGINPKPWPIPDVPVEVWQRLPEEDDGLESLARRWAAAPATSGCLPVAGSQAAIQALPCLRRQGRIGVPRPAYSEHEQWWRAAGHEVVPFTSLPQGDELAGLDALVWINPNNPTATLVSREQLMACHTELASRGGWLVVDEAFMDADPTQSLAPEAGREGLVLLRSLGKFFGLAGLRAGLMFGPEGLCNRLRTRLGPWAVSHPARYLMAKAIDDEVWQHEAAQWLQTQARRLEELLRESGLEPAGSTSLFVYCPHPAAQTLTDKLASQAVLVRRFDEPAALRFGLPGSEVQWQHLRQALAKL